VLRFFHKIYSDLGNMSTGTNNGDDSNKNNEQFLRKFLIKKLRNIFAKQ